MLKNSSNVPGNFLYLGGSDGEIISVFIRAKVFKFTYSSIKYVGDLGSLTSYEGR